MPHRFAPLIALAVGCGEAPEVFPAAPAPLPGFDRSTEPDPEPISLPVPAGPAEDRRPLLTLRHRCEDRRTPRLAGAWALGCDALGRVALAQRLTDGLEVELAQPRPWVGTAPGVVGAADPGLVWRLPDPRPAPAGFSGIPGVAAPAFDGERFAVAREGRVSHAPVGHGDGPSIEYSREASPLPWFPPAMSWPTVLWADGRDQPASGLDLWRWDTDKGPPRPWVTRPGDQRHVVAADGWAAWLDDEGVWLERLADGARWRHRAETGFRAPPSLWHGVVCWEERTAGELDVACSDGVRADGDGDQGWPSRWGPWLLYRQGDDAWLATAREVMVEADDPRSVPVEGGPGFYVLTAWPLRGWCAEVRAGGTWSAAGPAPAVDAVRWTIPGDALRLRPGAPGESCPGEALR